MGYTNSPLVGVTNLAPSENHYGARNHTIDTLTIHEVWGQMTAANILSLFATASRGASCNYCVGEDGIVGLCVEEKNASGCSSNQANDQRAITIETSNSRTYPNAVSDNVYETLIKLCADICQRNGKTKMVWCGSLAATNARNFAANEMRMTLHHWFASTDCPGNWLESHMQDIADRVNKLLAKGKNGLQDQPAEDGNWYYLKDGCIDTSFTGLAENINGWWYIKDGKVDFGFCGFCPNEWGTWYVKYGHIDFQDWSIEYGNIDGVEGWYLVEANKFKKKTTVAHNPNGWWYCKDGKVDFDYNGLAQNENGIWFIKDGKVDFSVNGKAEVAAEFKEGKLIL